MGVFRVPVTLRYPGTGGPGANVWSVRTGSITDPDDDSELDAALDAIGDFYDGMLPVMCAGFSYELGPDIVERNSLEDHSRPVRTGNGSGVGMLPPHLALCISWRTSLRARRGMGRTFLGPLADGTDDPATGTPSATFLNSIQPVVQALIDRSTSSIPPGWGVGVWGLQNPGAYDQFGRLIPGQAHVHRDFVSWKVRDQYAVMRSRRD